MDSLFLGDEYAAKVNSYFFEKIFNKKDGDFIISSKINRIINCAGR